MRRVAPWWLGLAALLAVPAAAQDGTTIVGAWRCVEGACPDEQIEFALEDGTRIYRSWLHDRPAVIDGRWKLDARQLVIEYGDLSEPFELIRVTRRTLRLRELGGDEATLRRIE